jgi:hypothetical protein
VNRHERIVIHKDEGRGGSSKKLNYKAEETVSEGIPWDRTIWCRLYHENLCSFVPYNPIEIPATTTKKFPFQFTLPKDLLESYSQNLWIEYQTTAVAERPWKRYRCTGKSFSIFSPYE